MADQMTVSKASGDFGGLRMTKQRQVVYDVLADLGPKHPTASEVFVTAKERMPSISLATVYNCLETLTGAGAIKQVNIDREASRYCPNLQPHAHFYCTGCDQVFDIGLEKGADASSIWALPSGCLIEEMNVAMKGVCGTCPKCRTANGHS
ncbi:MAG: Fur family transcriptional regulator [Verrucomicrobiales bacterium]|jgi:Fe2+ or Zn2+ uptake regulation protein